MHTTYNCKDITFLCPTKKRMVASSFALVRPSVCLSVRCLYQFCDKGVKVGLSVSFGHISSLKQINNHVISTIYIIVYDTKHSYEVV